MKRIFRIPIYFIEMEPEQFDATVREALPNEVSIAVFDYMKKYHEHPKHIDIYEMPHQFNFMDRDILQEPKTGMYKFKGELITYGMFCEKMHDSLIKDYEIEVY